MFSSLFSKNGSRYPLLYLLLVTSRASYRSFVEEQAVCLSAKKNKKEGYQAGRQGGYELRYCMMSYKYEAPSELTGWYCTDNNEPTGNQLHIEHSSLQVQILFPHPYDIHFMRSFLLLNLIVWISALTEISSAFVFGGKYPFTKNDITPMGGNDDEVLDVAKFFTESFWRHLTPSQYKLLLSSQVSEFRKKYGKSRKKIKKAPELFVSKTENGQITGCVGIELSCITPSKNEVGSSKYSSPLEAARVPLMSNLVVGKKYRRKGLARDLSKVAEEWIRKEYGFDECYLNVDKANTPALKLYKKLGYRIESVDDKATLLRPDANGKLAKSTTIILLMRKPLGKPFSWMPF